MYREESKFLPYVLLRYSKPRCGCISLLYAKAGGKNILICLSVQRKAVPLQADYYQKFIKD